MIIYKDVLLSFLSLLPNYYRICTSVISTKFRKIRKNEFLKSSESRFRRNILGVICSNSYTRCFTQLGNVHAFCVTSQDKGIRLRYSSVFVFVLCAVQRTLRAMSNIQTHEMSAHDIMPAKYVRRRSLTSLHWRASIQIGILWCYLRNILFKLYS